MFSVTQSCRDNYMMCVTLALASTEGNASNPVLNSSSEFTAFAQDVSKLTCFLSLLLFLFQMLYPAYFLCFHILCGTACWLPVNGRL